MQQDERDPQVLPVEKRKIRGLAKHVLVHFPGLHEHWVTPKKFIHYVFPPAKTPDGDCVLGAKQMWLETMSYMLDDIWWLCELQYHQFWSQIVFDPSAMNSIKSFLHLAPLQQLYFRIDDPDMLVMYKSIKRAVFQFMKRLLRTTESDLNYMSPEKYAEIMKKGNLVPVSLLFCLCTLYAKKEMESVREMVAHVVLYNDNLKLDNCVTRTIQLFSRMKTKLKQAYRVLKANMMHRQSIDEVRLAVNAYRQNLSSCVQFLANAAMNISNFLSVYSEGCEIFMIHDFDFHIIRVYKKLIVPAYLEISVMYGDSRYVQSYPKLISMLELTRLEFVKSFHICLNMLVNKFTTRLLAQETIQRIVQLMKLGSRVDNFLVDVNSVRSLNEFHELVKKKCPSDVDLTKLNKVFESINNEFGATKGEQNTKNSIEDDQIYDYVKDDYDAESDDSTELENDREIENDRLSLDDRSSEYSDWSRNENSDAEYEYYLDEDSPAEEAVASSSVEPVPISEMALQSAISQVKDLLPHLGDGFIAMCLRAYKMDVSAVINAVLEESLPVHLKGVDFSLSKVPSDILQNVERGFENTPSTSENKNEKSELKEFKRVEYSSYKDMFNDKSAISQAKDIYEKYRNTEEDELYNDDVDEDYEELLFAPPTEVDAEGFYTEYVNLPVCNLNHKYAEEECDEEKSRPGPSHQESNKNRNWRNREPNKNVKKSQPEGNWRNRKSSNPREKRDEIRDTDEPPKRNKRNLKKKAANQSFNEDNGGDEPRKLMENGCGSIVSGSRDFPENHRDQYPHSETVANERHPPVSRNSQRSDWRRGNDLNSRDHLEETNHRSEDGYSGSSRVEFRNSGRRGRNQPHFSDGREGKNERPFRKNVRTEPQGDGRIRGNHQEASTSRYHRNESSNMDDSQDGVDNGGPKPLDFCENPEVTRARREHERRVKMQKRRGPMQFYDASKNPGKATSDDQEQRDRHYKDVHKSSNANHSRKYFADKKRRQ